MPGQTTGGDPPTAQVSVLFSEPKIPQYVAQEHLSSDYVVSVLFSEPKIPQFIETDAISRRKAVSVLFSEPKIPQCRYHARTSVPLSSFSALQRAENSSIALLARLVGRLQVSVLFSEPKIPQLTTLSLLNTRRLCFSALQRAENSSIQGTLWLPPSPFGAFQCSSASRKFLNVTITVLDADYAIEFQCSSASRKFLNRGSISPKAAKVLGFSALQRAENSSM